MTSFRELLWPLLRLLYPSFKVGPLEVIDVGLMWEDKDEVQLLFQKAIQYFKQPDDATELTTLRENLRRVAVVREGFEGIAVDEGKYGTTLGYPEGSNPFYLACRLLWVARYIELLRAGGADGRSARDESFDTVLAWAERHTEGDEWIRYIERERMRDLS
jgi:hypothetical protein